MQIIKAEKIITKTSPLFGCPYLVFASVMDNGILIAQHGFRFYTKKDALVFIQANS